jgi:hypothetical protein
MGAVTGRIVPNAPAPELRVAGCSMRPGRIRADLLHRREPTPPVARSSQRSRHGKTRAEDRFARASSAARQTRQERQTIGWLPCLRPRRTLGEWFDCSRRCSSSWRPAQRRPAVQSGRCRPIDRSRRGHRLLARPVRRSLIGQGSSGGSWTPLTWAGVLTTCQRVREPRGHI